MKGLWIEEKDGVNTVQFREDLPLPEKKTPGDVLVKVLRAGICNTDLELIKGYYPYTGVLGHEFVGQVEDDTAPDDLRGKLVVGEINLACHNCWFCDQKIPTHCSKRTVMGIVNHWGTYAEYLVLPKENLHVVPDGVGIKEACFAEPLAAALQIGTQISIKESDKVAVVGDGKLGLLIAQGMATYKCDLTAFGHHQEKLDILSKQGIKTCLTTSPDDMYKYDIVVECTGSKKGLVSAIEMVRPRGILVMKSTHHGNAEIDTAKVVVNELHLVGSRCGPMDQAVEALQQKRVDVMSLFQAEFPLQDCMKALELAGTKGTLKIQLICSE